MIELKLKLDGYSVKVIPLGNQLMFSFGEVRIISRLIEGNFPNYEQVIPKDEKAALTVDRQKLLAAVRRASLLTSPEAQFIKLDVSKNKVQVSSRSPNIGESREEVEGETQGDEVVIGFNPNYLIDVLRNVDAEKVSLSFTNPDKPGIVKGKEGYLCVIMPMQIN